MRLLLLQVAFLLQFSTLQAFLDFLSDFGAIPYDSSPAVCAKNRALLEHALQHNASYQTLVIPTNQTFYLHHGIVASNLINSAIQINGALVFERESRPLVSEDLSGNSPTDETPLLASILLQNCENVTITSSRQDEGSNDNVRGVLNGQGSQFWGAPLIGRWERPLDDSCPILVAVHGAKNLVVERVILQDAPRYSLQLLEVHNSTVQYSSIVTRRTGHDGHTWIDLSAVDTIGIQLASGCQNIHIHDVDIWNQDDCISIRSTSSTVRRNQGITAEIRDVVVERVNASGFGFVVAAQGEQALVNNVTFRDSYLHKSVRGLSVKFYSNAEVTHGGGTVSNVAFQNVFLEAPTQWSFWFGPAQTANASLPNPCQDQTCSICWPAMATVSNPKIQCHAVPNSALVNLTLTNVTLHNPRQSPGVFLGSQERHASIENVVLDRVKVVLSNSNTTDAHPFVKNLFETFPGLSQPLADDFVPNSNASSQKNSVVTDSSDHATNVYVISGLIAIAVSVLVISLIATGKDEHSNRTHTSAESVDPPIPISSSQSQSPSDEDLLNTSSTIQPSKRVRFVEGLSTLKDKDSHQTHSGDSETSLFSLVTPLLDRPHDPPDTTMLPTRRVADSFRWSHAHWASLLVLLTVTGMGAWSWKWYCLHRRRNSDSGTPEWDKTDRYFQCEGVVHGIAKGGTWPVPYCLNQRPSQWWVVLTHLHGVYLWIFLSVIGVIVLMGVFVLAWKYCKRRDHCAVNLPSSLSDNSPS